MSFFRSALRRKRSPCRSSGHSFYENHDTFIFTPKRCPLPSTTPHLCQTLLLFSLLVRSSQSLSTQHSRRHWPLPTRSFFKTAPTHPYSFFSSSLFSSLFRFPSRSLPALLTVTLSSPYLHPLTHLTHGGEQHTHSRTPLTLNYGFAFLWNVFTFAFPSYVPQRSLPAQLRETSLNPYPSDYFCESNQSHFFSLFAFTFPFLSCFHYFSPIPVPSSNPFSTLYNVFHLFHTK